MKIAVYGICLNEEHHIPRWIKSAQDADYIFIADTGSEDHSIAAAMQYKFLNVHVAEIAIRPWRFDMAFNAALAQIPDYIDVCIPLGLDEVLEPGWRDALEKAWVLGVTTKCSVTYYQNYPSGNTDTFQNDRPHARFGYIWRYPCHEQTYPYGINPIMAHAPNMVISHHQAKRNRSNYINLLRIGYTENPQDPRMIHYYGRELYYYKNYTEAIKYLRAYRLAQNREMNPYEWDANEKYLEECQKNVATLQQS